MRSLAILALLVVGAGAQTTPKLPPEQPLPFSHKTHSDAKLECKLCHSNPAPGKTMGIARPSACMPCHKTVKPQSPAIRTLATFARKDREIEWVRVYQIPSFVKFSHRLHMAAGNTCEECHGPVATRAQLASERDLSQTGCVACHRAKQAGLTCATCHD